MRKIQEEVKKVFLDAFGRTPLRQRLEDICKEAEELKRYIDIANIKEELGDILASSIMLANEMEMDAETLVRNTLAKIKRRKVQYKSLGRKLKVALYGGAFDPPTVGHIQAAQFVLDTSKMFDEVWLMPCYEHMYSKDMAFSRDRINMCNLAAECDGRIKAFDYEIKNQLKGETYHLVKRLLEEDFAKDEVDFSYIIGMDNALTFDQWVNYEDLERMIPFIVVPRKGYEADILSSLRWFLKPPHIFLGISDNPIKQISSTEIRNSIIAGESIEGMVPEKVEWYIEKHGLYKEKQNDK